MAATARRPTTRRTWAILAIVGAGALLAGGAATLVRAGRDRPSPRTAPAAVLADASDVKGLAVTSDDGLWWVPPTRSPARWRHVEVFAASQPAWVGAGLVVAGPDGLVLADADGGLRARVPYPAGLADGVVLEAPLSAVELPDGRMRVALIRVIEPSVPQAIVLTVAADARSATAATYPAGAFGGYAALSPDGARVAFVDPRGALVTAPATGGATSTVRGAQPSLYDVAVVWTTGGIVLPLQASIETPFVPTLVDPDTGTRRAVRFPARIASTDVVVDLRPRSTARDPAQWWCDVRGPDPLRPACTRLELAPDQPARMAVRTAAGTIVARYEDPQAGDGLLVQPLPAVGDLRNGGMVDHRDAQYRVAGLSTA